MTDEETFQAAIDADPTNSALRLVFADWLEERGDWRAAGYRWMGENHKWPYDWSKNAMITVYNTFDWFIDGSPTQWDVPKHCILPAEFRRWFPTSLYMPSFETRREAEEALCKVIFRRAKRMARARQVS